MDRLMEDNAQQFPDSHESVEDIVIQKFLRKITYGALKVAKEGSGIDLCTVLRRKTERVYAKQIGVSPSTVHRRKEEIIKN